VVLDREGREVGTVGEPGNIFNVSLSPDGRRLATSRGETTVDLWITDTVRGVSSRFTFDPGNELTPVWSPDGSTLAFNSDRRGRDAVFLKPADGVQAESLLHAEDGQFGVGDWSRDGKYLACIKSVSREGGIYILNADGSGEPRPVVVTPFFEIHPRFSPDGRWLVYASDESDRIEIYVQSLQGGSGKWQVSRDGGRDPRWSRDGKEIYFIDGGNRIAAVDVAASTTLTLGTPRVIVQRVAWDPDRYGGNYDVSADGSRFYVRRNFGAASLPATTVYVNWMEGLRRR
jgi:Tol biopolymer transport system component